MSHSIFTQQITEQLEQMILQYATMWMNLPNNKLSERNHTKESMYDSIYIKYTNREYTNIHWYKSGQWLVLLGKRTV